MTSFPQVNACGMMMRKEALMSNPQTEPRQPSPAGTPGSHSTQAPDQANGVNIDLRTECERLRQAVERLEEERRRDLEFLETVRKERDEYRRAMYAWARQQFTEEEIRNIPD